MHSLTDEQLRHEAVGEGGCQNVSISNYLYNNFLKLTPKHVKNTEVV